MSSNRFESESDDSEICIQRKRRRKNPFLDDEAEFDGSCSDDEPEEIFDADLADFIDDSEDLTANDFRMNKTVEIDLNRENLLQFLTEQTKHDLEQIGLRFVYSHPTDLFK